MFVPRSVSDANLFAIYSGMACSFIKKETLKQVFSCEFWEIFKNTFFYRTPPGNRFWKFATRRKLIYFLWDYINCHVFTKNLFLSTQITKVSNKGRKKRPYKVFRNFRKGKKKHKVCFVVCFKSAITFKYLLLRFFYVSLGFNNAKKSYKTFVKFSIKKAALKNFAIFTGKHLCCSIFLIIAVFMLRLL